MSDAAPPPWTKRAPGLSATHKFMLTTLWGWGPYVRTGPKDPDGEHQPAAPVRPFPSRETLAEITGQALGTVKSQLRALVKAGWVRRDSGSTMTLAWRAPGCFDYGERLDSRPPRLNPQPAESPAPTAESSTPADEIPAGGRLNPRPLSSNHLPISSSSDLDEERATPPTPSESTSPNEVTHGPDDPGRVPRPNPPHAEPLVAELPAHTREVLDRASASSRGVTDEKSKRPGPERHSLTERIAAVSQAALLHFDQSDGPSPHPASFAATMRVFMAEHDEETALRVLAAWEQARASGGPRPAMGQLWHTWGPGNGKDWVKRKVHETAPRTLHVVMSPRELYEAEQREIYGDDWQTEAAAR